jgi:hypothetical protein
MLLRQRPTQPQEPPTICPPRQHHAIPRTLVGIALLCDANLTVILTKHDVKEYDQVGTTILKGWRDPGGANEWHFPIIDSNHNSNEDSLTPSNNQLTIIPPPNHPPEPLPLPATPVPDTYWDRIKHKKQPARMVQLTYREWFN